MLSSCRGLRRGAKKSSINCHDVEPIGNFIHLTLLLKFGKDFWSNLAISLLGVLFSFPNKGKVILAALIHTDAKEGTT